MTVRERIKGLQTSMLAGNVTPELARQCLMQITGLLGYVLDESREADSEFNAVLVGFLDSDEAANRARIRAQASPQYARAREAKDCEKLVDEMIRSCKVYLKSLDTEIGMAR